jgi:hypothetical protein
VPSKYYLALLRVAVDRQSYRILQPWVAEKKPAAGTKMDKKTGLEGCDITIVNAQSKLHLESSTLVQVRNGSDEETYAMPILIAAAADRGHWIITSEHCKACRTIDSRL